MRAEQLIFPIESFIRRRWRMLALVFAAAVAMYWAVTLSDAEGRADLPRGYAVRMTCEKDPESYLWSGGCDRIAADIARHDKPSFGELYLAFVDAHHSAIPSPQATRAFAEQPCDEGFAAAKAIKGTRYILTPEAFAGVCKEAYAKAIMNEIDTRDRALLTIERAGLSWSALVAGALANLTEPLVIFGCAAVGLALWLL